MKHSLQTRNLSLSFGGLAVTRDVNISLAEGARTALIGPNGAGKTTLINLLSGVLRPNSGDILMGEQSIVKLPQYERVRSGIVRTFQISRLFKELTVAENVEIAVLQRLRLATEWWPSRARTSRVRDEVDETLGLLGLRPYARRVVGKLALGEQRLAEIALALAMKPRVLLLDEPAAGVPQGEGGRIMDAVESLPKDLSVLLIEHDMDLVFRFASHIIVLAAGAVLAEGAPREVAANERVKQIYFGRDGHGQAHF
ncbi:ABC transporter ATP-binding protein [Noviherbaspirillum galbum]|uniref:ABC transporter ATP-binding protein n=1 Tax=Noviherbaspirillum galbum TaxID=2709383 RepID=A0A6B3SV64_9BURK|nr:ABC transporter ATP-binding protein [Noviherbaspirillum galbum]NEX64703.1 ABC transporter ATP-binding protein [Noviherbaspirillum galbum]